MEIAYILINSELGKGSQIENGLQKIDEVKEVYAIYGAYDYIVKVETNNLNELNIIISEKIRQIGHIRSTLTMITTNVDDT